jgi:serine/threonine-protein kinase
MVDRAAAQTLFDDAVQLVAAQRYKEACPKLEESQRIDPGIGTQFNLADCYEKIGRTASAWVNFSEVADAALKEGNPERERVAKDRANAVSKRLSYFTVTVPHPANGLVVTRDGVEIRPGTWGTAFPLDPGNYVVEATAPNRKAWKKTIELGKDGAKAEAIVPEFLDVPIEPGPKPLAAPFALTPPPSTPADSSSRSHQKTWALVSAGVGVVGVGIGTVLLLSAESTYSKSNPYCGSNNKCTDPQGVTYRKDAISRANLATIPMGIGLAGLGAGLTLWLTAPSTKEADRPVAGLSLSPNEVTIRGRF